MFLKFSGFNAEYKRLRLGLQRLRLVLKDGDFDREVR